MIKEIKFRKFGIQVIIEKLDGLWLGFEIGGCTDFQVWIELLKVTMSIRIWRE